MSNRMWSREKLLKWAKRLEIPVPPGASDQKIYTLVMNARATNEQLLELTSLLSRLTDPPPLPPNMTFGRAAKAIHAAHDLLNTSALEAMNIHEGEVWQIVGTDTCFMVMQIHGNEKDHMLSVRYVVLDRASDAPRATTIATSNKDYDCHPYRLSVTRVDLDAWQPELSSGSDELAP